MASVGGFTFHLVGNLSFSPQSVSPPAELLAGAGGSPGHQGEEVGGKLSGDQEVSLRHQVVHSSPALGAGGGQSADKISQSIYKNSLSHSLSPVFRSLGDCV